MRSTLQRAAIFLTLLVITPGLAAQQYPQWLQYLFNHQSINPAYAAVGENRGFFMMNRTQLTGNNPPDYTWQFSYFSPVFNNFNGAGIDLTADRTDSLSHFTLFLNYSYELLLESDLFLRLGGTFGVSHISRTGATESDILGNFGIGAFLYNKNGFFSLAIPRLIKNNAQYLKPDERLLHENRLLFFSTAALLPINENLRVKPQLFYIIPLGKSTRMDILFTLYLKEKNSFGMVWSPADHWGFMARHNFSDHISAALAYDRGRHDISGKPVSHLSISLIYKVNIYDKEKQGFPCF